MINITRLLIILWPLIVTIFALYYHKKQNGDKPLTGGPISKPKSFWLAYTITTWFFFPLILLTSVELENSIKFVLIFHLVSWWLRGPIELVMIYKYFNWTPKYGISHDFFHLCGILILFFSGQIEKGTGSNFIAYQFILITIFATLAEILFAYLFLIFRSKIEEEENIYFASDDPKWILINRITLTVVIIVMGHLFWQSYQAFVLL